MLWHSPSRVASVANLRNGVAHHLSSSYRRLLAFQLAILCAGQSLQFIIRYTYTLQSDSYYSMSLRVLSPHPHSCDPQSPYPCTPSTICNSPPVNSASQQQQKYFASDQQQLTPNNQLQHRIQPQTFVTDSSPLSQLAQAFRNTRARQLSAEGGGGPTFTSSELPGTPTQNQIESAYIRNAFDEDDDQIDIMMDTESHSNASVTSSPIVPVSVRSPSMSTISGTPERLRRHTQSSIAIGNSDIVQHGAMKTHPSTQSIPIILASRNISKTVCTLHGKELSSESISSLSDVLECTDSDGENRNSVGSGVGLGLNILQDPIELKEALTTPRGSVRGASTTCQISFRQFPDKLTSCATVASPFEPPTTLSAGAVIADVSASDPIHLEEMLGAPRQERADSWTSSSASMEYSSSSSSNSATTIPITPASDAFPASQDVSSGLGSPMQTDSHKRSNTATSEFSVSAYNYTPLLDQGPLVDNWTTSTAEVGLSSVSSITQETLPKLSKDVRKRTVSVAAAKDKHSGLNGEKQIKKRRRAATLATRPEDMIKSIEGARPQTSPPPLTRTRFVEGYATTKKRPNGPHSAMDLMTTPTRLPVRPSTTGNDSRMSPLTLLKPLPSVPALRSTQTATKKPSLLSIETSPRRPTLSRPATASPAARSFGLVSIPSPSRPSGSYAHVRNRNSVGSVAELKNDMIGRSRAVSVSSQASGSITPQQGSSWPPRYITLAIDQESFRKVAPVLELQEELAKSPSPLASESAVTGQILRYLPVYPDHTYPFHHSAMEGCPVLRKLCIEGQEDKSFMHKQSILPIKNEGIYAVKGASAKGEHQWRFEYRVEDRLNLVGKPIPGEKVRSGRDTWNRNSTDV